ncbi:hypothetical protein RRF57_001749 [Xylaria bambusicola]|uniref:Uncharacterized protein n=1 Tax=Xylaria bambusicola TaxID=326684 RepID=A0AAN7Z3V4_9PEZI
MQRADRFSKLSYDLNGTSWDSKHANGQTWIYAREVRAQQAKAPLESPKRAKYPSKFANLENLPLTTPGKPTPNGRTAAEWLHHPMIPGTATTYSDMSRSRPGAIRTFYTEGDRSNFDVGHHDPKTKTSTGKEGFSMAKYIPAASKPNT